MTKPVLIVEDDPLQREMLGTLLRRKLGYESHMAAHGREALDILGGPEAAQVRLVILDLDLPVMGGMEALQILKQQYPEIAVIMLTGSKNIDDAVKALKIGAIDFLNKPFEGERMVATVKNALKISTLSKEVSRLNSERTGRFTFNNLIGHDGGLTSVVTLGRKAAASDIPVLITGQTGTGKEAVAKAVHGESTRAGKAFIAVNCGAIPSQLVESALFGHEKGAFTGATEKTLGKFREADGGTILLDEVGELPLDAQVKLLRVLQQKEVEPVGAGKPVPVNLRVISATNRDLEQDVKAGRFREDLFFRLNVLQIQLPSLNERRTDILPLAYHFIERFCANEVAAPKTISSNAQKMLMHHDWPGNVRQLENAINRAMVVSTGAALEEEDFSSTWAQEAVPVISHRGFEPDSIIEAIDENGMFKSMGDIEQEAMRLALSHYDGNITQAAKALGIAKSTFYRKIKDTDVVL